MSDYDEESVDYEDDPVYQYHEYAEGSSVEEEDIPDAMRAALMKHPALVTVHEIFKLIAWVVGMASFGFGIYWLFERTWWQGILIIAVSPFVVGAVLLFTMMVIAVISRLIPARAGASWDS